MTKSSKYSSKHFLMLPDSLTIPFKILIWKEIRKNNYSWTQSKYKKEFMMLNLKILQNQANF